MYRSGLFCAVEKELIEHSVDNAVLHHLLPTSKEKLTIITSKASKLNTILLIYQWQNGILDVFEDWLSLIWLVLNQLSECCSAANLCLEE